MKTYKKMFFAILMTAWMMGTNVLAASDTGSEIISEVMHNMNTISCNQYLIDNNHYFAKICPNKYKEIDIDYDTDKKAITFVYSPLKSSKFVTKYKLVQIVKQQSDLAHYLNISENEFKAWIKQSNIISTMIVKHNDDIDMNIRYAFIIFKNFPEANKITPKDIKDLGTAFGRMITRDKHFTLKNAKKNDKIYVPVQSTSWIYDRVNGVYYYHDSFGNYNNSQCENCYDNNFKVILKPFTVFWISCLHHSCTPAQDAITQIITRHRPEIRTINENTKYIEIIFNIQLNRKQIEKMITDFIYKSYVSTPIGANGYENK